MLFHTLWEGWDFPPPLVGQDGLIQQLQPERALSPLLSQWDMGVAAASQERAAQRTLRRRRRHKLPSIPSPLQILERLNKMCGVGEQMRKKQQRLLKNMDAHKVMLDLLQIPYDKVTWRPTQFMLGTTALKANLRCPGADLGHLHPPALSSLPQLHPDL